ncbi:MAG: GreA/GreB family elongation factor [Prolixibacteraceae bacterium]|nr:GreA/GreB family elongation factor [Prolixibacteraceae bacterium]
MGNEIILTEVDYVRLNSLIYRLLDENNQDIRAMNFLNIEIKRAKKVTPKRIKPDIVTMDSSVEVTFLETGKTKELKLVYPQNSNYEDGLISVLSTFGCALLGAKVGDSVSYRISGVTQTVRIEKILFQPEANGEDLL